MLFRFHILCVSKYHTWSIKLLNTKLRPFWVSPVSPFHINKYLSYFDSIVDIFLLFKTKIYSHYLTSKGCHYPEQKARKWLATMTQLQTQPRKATIWLVPGGAKQSHGTAFRAKTSARTRVVDGTESTSL